MDAQGAVDSLVGRLTSILIDEAQLLRGVRGDVVFIKDEMESMNSLLAHLTESQHRNQQVRTWMKHVVGLTRDCEGNVELYVRYISGANPRANRGALGRLRRVVRFVLTVRARRRVATQIRRLKVRARDVGDRRLRYGVTVPPTSAAAQANTTLFDVPAPQEPGKEDDAHRRAQLGGEPPDHDDAIIRKGTDQVIEWLFEDKPGQLRVIPIVCKDSSESESALAQMAANIGQEVYNSVANSFRCNALIDLVKINPRYRGIEPVLAEILQQFAPTTRRPPNPSQLAKKLRGHLKGKRFLIVLQRVQDKNIWASIRSALFQADSDCHPGSAIIVTTVYDDIVDSPSPYKTFKARSLRGFMYVRANALVNTSYCGISNVRTVLELCYPDAFAMKMVLHLLYANRNMTADELKTMGSVLSECERLKKSIAKQMLMFCYAELPSKYRSCLLYLSIFPKDHIISTSNLARRWIVEGLITAKKDHTGSVMDRRKHQASATDEAECYFDMLITRGFLIPWDISAAGNIKNCKIHHEVHEFITKIATDVNFLDTDLPPDLAHHLSIHNRIKLKESHSNHHVEADSHDIVAFLPDLAKSSQWQLLKVLDLQGCKGLTKKHMNNICKVLLLKYLSLRDTDITELPKQINRLRCLETLDIRQTEIRAFVTKSIMLPMLKHLLAGQKRTPSNNSDRFVTMRLPSGIRKMEKLEILSHVEVSCNADDIIGVGQLLQLRKLGVVLDGDKGSLVLLFEQIEKLHGCLRSLSIRINQPAKSEGTPDARVVALASPPKLLQNLTISGITAWLPLPIAELDQLTKITLSETDLGEDDLRIIGKLRILCCLKLRHKSYTRSKLSFKKEEFQHLKSLVVEGSDITNIAFDARAAPKLEMIVWYFASMESLSGVNHLPKLKKVELNGESHITDQVRQTIKDHHNCPDFKINGQQQ